MRARHRNPFLTINPLSLSENCPAPTSASGYSIVNNIRSIAQIFGSVKLFKAYLEVTEPSRAVLLRSELQSSGVSLTDCPHNGRKDVADKMIIGVFASFQHTHLHNFTIVSGHACLCY